tara:strand:- start:511 stop:1227 length:717 start_codon:yes stop_codon:yes gene_type:complete
MTNTLIKLFKIFLNRSFISALFKGVGAGTEHIKHLKVLSVNHVIDIGANKGQFALVSRSIYPNARIDSFEPLSEPADIYEKVFKNYTNVFLHRFAIGEKEEEKIIYVSNKEDSSSLLPIGDKQNFFFPGTHERSKRLIKVVLLEKLIKNNDIISPAFLKIDVQGYELQTLYGCHSLFEKIKYIYCECSFQDLYEGQSLAHEIIEFLSKNNYFLIGIYNLHYTSKGQVIQGDFLFKKRR